MPTYTYPEGNARLIEALNLLRTSSFPLPASRELTTLLSKLTPKEDVTLRRSG